MPVSFEGQVGQDIAGNWWLTIIINHRTDRWISPPGRLDAKEREAANAEAEDTMRKLMNILNAED